MCTCCWDLFAPSANAYTKDLLLKKFEVVSKAWCVGPENDQRSKPDSPRQKAEVHVPRTNRNDTSHNAATYNMAAKIEKKANCFPAGKQSDARAENGDNNHCCQCGPLQAQNKDSQHASKKEQEEDQPAYPWNSFKDFHQAPKQREHVLQYGNVREERIDECQEKSQNGNTEKKSNDALRWTELAALFLYREVSRRHEITIFHL